MRSRVLLSVATALLTGAAAAGCGSGEEAGGRPSTVASPAPGPSEASRPKPAPDGGGRAAAAVASNLGQPNLILDGGQTAMDEKLAELEGAPVVVNQWASWCPPCRDELPFFNDSAEAHAKAGDVAFLGTNYLDDREAADRFLSEVPVVFPSVFDPDGETTRGLEGGTANPSTMFLDGEHEVAYVRQGAYPDQASLEADIERYLLG